MTDERLEIVGWQRFQHYKDRDPPWIKNYTRLLADHNYLRLTLRQRGILHGLWLLYAASGRDLGASAARLGQMLGDPTVRRRDLERLNEAGFIRILASTPLAIARSREVEVQQTRLSKDERTPSRARESDDAEELFEHAEDTLEPLATLDELWRPHDH